jgi:hypothetical protein
MPPIIAKHIVQYPAFRKIYLNDFLSNNALMPINGNAKNIPDRMP